MWTQLVRQLLAQPGMTQAALARKVKLSQPSISALLNNKYVHGPRADVAMRLLRLRDRIVKKEKVK